MVKFSEVILPTNRKFGFFFTFVFLLSASYSFYSLKTLWAYGFILSALIFLVITLLKSEILLPLNKFWMRFGLLLAIIVSPIVLGVIFFGFFTPIALLMRLGGRDELRLEFSQKTSHWIIRRDSIKPVSFKNQF